MDLYGLGKLVTGTLLVALGGCLWAFAGAGEAGAALIGAGGAMLPSAVSSSRSA